MMIEGQEAEMKPMGSSWLDRHSAKDGELFKDVASTVG